MKLESFEISCVSHPLTRPMRTARGELSERSGFVVDVRDEDGHRGRGEALPLPDFGTEDLDVCETALRVMSAQPGEVPGSFEREWEHAPAARCAVDTALLELEATRANVPVAELLVGEPRRRVAVNAVLSLSDEETTVAGARDAVANGFETLKLKVGPELLEELPRLRAVRDAVGPTVRIRLDANGSCSTPVLRRALPELVEIGIELFEQPLPADEFDALRTLHAEAEIPIGIDETLARADGRDALLRGDLGSVAVLKPMVQGGVRPCVELAHRARRAGVRTLVTTTFDGPIATAAALHLAAAIGDRSHASGLATHDALRTEFPPFLVAKDGWLTLNSTPGLGV